VKPRFEPEPAGQLSKVKQAQDQERFDRGQSGVPEEGAVLSQGGEEFIKAIILSRLSNEGQAKEVGAQKRYIINHGLDREDLSPQAS
jgi:hypothetical protein